MAKLIKGTHHISLNTIGVEAFEKTVHFYRDILGMDVVRTWGADDRLGIMIDTGNGPTMEITSNGKEEFPAGSIRHFALATDDVDAAIEAVRAEGYTITVEPRDYTFPNSDPQYNIRMGFCIGPCNETIEFFCEK